MNVRSRKSIVSAAGSLKRTKLTQGRFRAECRSEPRSRQKRHGSSAGFFFELQPSSAACRGTASDLSMIRHEPVTSNYANPMSLEDQSLRDSCSHEACASCCCSPWRPRCSLLGPSSLEVSSNQRHGAGRTLTLRRSMAPLATGTCKGSRI